MKGLLGRLNLKDEINQTCSTHGGNESRVFYIARVSKSENKWPLGRSRHRWKVNIKMNLRELGNGSVNKIQVDRDGITMAGF
jgi:hypothetical protein